MPPGWILGNTLSDQLKPGEGNVNILINPKGWETRAARRLAQGHSPGKGMDTTYTEVSILFLERFPQSAFLSPFRRSRDREGSEPISLALPSGQAKAKRPPSTLEIREMEKRQLAFPERLWVQGAAFNSFHTLPYSSLTRTLEGRLTPFQSTGNWRVRT